MRRSGLSGPRRLLPPRCLSRSIRDKRMRMPWPNNVSSCIFNYGCTSPMAVPKRIPSSSLALVICPPNQKTTDLEVFDQQIPHQSSWHRCSSYPSLHLLQILASAELIIVYAGMVDSLHPNQPLSPRNLTSSDHLQNSHLTVS